MHLEFGDDRWRKLRGLRSRLTTAAELALRRGKTHRGSGLTLLLTDDARLRALNRDFRGKDKPTNVLSFPAQENAERYLGDVAIAFGVAQREAKAGSKTLLAHATHLTVHGVLHLLGFDHVRPRDASAMEPLETRILAELGIADPYREAA
ncbi:MAG: rRNA maturation RNase YbeY [Proteobacteria bacterium]|nr:rRNA maturation RNase YbeY [Pseudomonadota bacterium]